MALVDHEVAALADLEELRHQRPAHAEVGMAILLPRLHVLAMDKLEHEVGAAFYRKIIVNSGDRGMMERGKHVGFPLEILDDGFTHQRVRRGVDHFLDRHQFGDIGKVHVAGAVNRTHPANPNHLLNGITLGKRKTRLKLTRRGRTLITLVIR